MPPPLKLIVTGEHEEVLWERKFLNTDTSLGMIQSVIFYLIKCFGLWQGKDLKSLKTEHVSFGEDNLGKFVTVDIKRALGSGKIIKRYDDPDNPRSVYKILKTYKGYLANEGPFLVRPISSIKDYICYSPWPLGVNIIEQTVVNLMQECGVGSGFGNISVCLMAIDILKSFGAGSHCISTWLFRLYPRYKKTFWADMFKKCSAINCEDKSQEACLMISHILDPPYPAATMLFEMKKKQEIIKTKIETVNAQRTHVFNSWLSNINSKQDGELAPDLNQGNELLDANAHMKTKMTLKALTAAKGHSIKTRTRNIKEALKRKLSPSEQSSDLNNAPGCPSNLPETSLITVKTELMSDPDPCENKSGSSDVKIMTVLSIPESAYSAQIDEAEYTINEDKIVRASTSTIKDSRTSAAIKPEHPVVPSRSSAVKRTLKCSEASDVKATSMGKQAKPQIKTEAIESSAQDEGDLSSHQYQSKSEGDLSSHQYQSKNEGDLSSHQYQSKNEGDLSSHQSQSNNVLLNGDESTHLISNVKLEPDSDYKDGIKAISDGPFVLDAKIKGKDNGISGDSTSNKLCQSDCIQNKNGHHKLPSKDGSRSSEMFTQDEFSHLQSKCRSNSASSNPPLDILANPNEGSHFPHLLKDKHMTSGAASSSSFVSAPSDQTKDDLVIQQKPLDRDTGESSAEVPASNVCDKLQCESTTFVGVSESPEKIMKKKCFVRGPQDQGALEPKPICLGHTCSQGKGIMHVDSCDVDGSTGVRCANVDSSVFSVSSHQEHSESNEVLARAGHTKNLDHCNSYGHLATDLVQFLDAAHKQLQNILKTSSTDANRDCASKNSGLDGSLRSSNVFKRKRRLGKVKVITSDKKPRIKEENSYYDLESGINTLGRCHQTLPLASSEQTGLQKSVTLVKDTSCPLLRSVLEENKTPQTKTKKPSASRNLPLTSKTPSASRNLPLTSKTPSASRNLPLTSKTPSASRNLPLTSKTNRHRKRFISGRLKAPLTLQTQLELDKSEKRFCGNHGNKVGSSLKPHSKDLNVVKQSSDREATLTGGCPPDPHHRSSEIAQPHSGIHCNHSPPTNVSPETSLLKEAGGDSHARSGIYHYKSDYHENAVYQMLQIKQESQGTTTFTISDLPIRADDSNAPKDNLHSPRSEICLGDYFPEGTVIPARGMKLLTRQSADGLEVVLKFDFNLLDNTPVNKDNGNDETKGNSEQGEGHLEFTRDKQSLVQVCSGNHFKC